MEKFYILIAGSRSYADYDTCKKILDYLLVNKKEVCVVSGGAKGADALAERYADERGYEKRIFPADWNKNGKRAGYLRNEEMHKFISSFENRGCVCFWDGESKGTAHNFELVKKYGTPIRVFDFKKYRYISV